jgi:two-component system sensor histidine kinase PilS (NtrC family)
VTVETIHAKLKWLIGLRVVVVTVFLGLFLALETSSRVHDTSVLFSFLIVGIYGLTIVYAVALKWLNPRSSEWFAGIQVTGDLACITTIVATTGGVESPFTFLYPIVIIAGTMVLGRTGGIVITALAGTIYAALVWGRLDSGSPAIWWAQRETFSPVVLNVLAFVAVFLLSNHLVAVATAATTRLAERESGFRALSAFHENIVQSMSSGLFTADLDGRLTSFNQAGYAILGASSAEVLGRPCWELFGWADGPSFYAGLSHHRIPYRFERETVRLSGERLLLGMTLSWLKDGNGEATGMVGIFQDLTEIKALEDRMRQRERLASVGELAAGLAHEIRNPLAAMSGAMQVLQHDLRFEGEHQALMTIALRESERLNDLIGQFLLYARPASSHKRSCDVVPLVRDTLALLKAHHDYRTDVEIHEEFTGPALWVRADANQLRQVVWNLLLNALQAMPQGGRLRVGLQTVVSPITGKPDAAEMVVSDTGNGIRAEDLRRIFVPFFTTKIGGSGLGLAIVHRIIEEHGGHVRVDSVQGRGTRMTVVLPAGRAIDDTVRDGYGADAEREAIIPVPGSGYAGGFAERYARGRP